MLNKIFNTSIIQKGITQEEQQIFDVSNPQISSLFGNMGVSSGVVVNEQTAMRLSSVYAAVQLLSKTLAMTPLILYRDKDGEGADGGKDRATDHPLYNVLKRVSYDWMPSFQLKESMMTGNLISGNSFAYIHKNRLGQCVGLQYMPHNFVSVEVNEQRQRKQYRYTVNGRNWVFDESEVLHIPSFGYDGIRGLSPIQTAMETIGKGLAVQEFGSRFFSNGAKPGGIFEHPNALSDSAFERLQESLSGHTGVSNSGKTLILEEGMSYKAISLSPEQSQFLETMKFTVSDIARIYGVPPHMIGDLERATFSNIESQDINFVKYSMLAWFIRWEQFVNMKCLTDEERRQGFFVEFLVDNLLRGDSKTRADVFHLMRQDGVINADEWRQKENMNRISDGGGQTYFINGNMMPVSNAMENKQKNNVGGENNTNT